MSTPVPTDRLPVELPDEEQPTWSRSPADVLRALVAAALLVATLLVGRFAGSSIVVLADDLTVGLGRIDGHLVAIVVGSARIATSVFLVSGLVAALLTRRFRLLALVSLSAVCAAMGADALAAWIGHTAGSVVEVSDLVGPVTDETFPELGGVAAATAAVTVAAPWLPRTWRRAAWAVVIVLALSRFVTAPLSFDTPIALCTGWLVGAAVLVAFGGPTRRSSAFEVADALAGVGVHLARLERASVDARGSTPYFGVDTDGRRLFVKVLGRDERSADLLFRLYRWVLPRDLGDERPFSSLRRAVEHEALLALAARDLGVRTPRFVAFAEAEPASFVLVYEAIAGRSLDRVDPEDFDDSLLSGVWEQVAVLRSHRIAHRDLRLANVFLDEVGEPWLIDFGFSELASTDLLLATDVAELLASTSIRVGPTRALDAARRVLGDDAVASAVPRLKAFALSGATRAAMKQRAGLLAEVRAGAEGAPERPA